MFCVPVCMKTKKSASVEAHQRFGALRIGTLRDHESVAAAYCLRRYLALQCRPQSQAPESPAPISKDGCLLNRHSFRDIRRSQATPASDVESSRLLGKNYESLLFQRRLVVCFQSPPWQSTCPYSPMETEWDSFQWRKLFCRQKNQRKSPVRFHFSAEKWFPLPAYGGQTIHVVPVLEISGCVNKLLFRRVRAVIPQPGSL